jgi:hypothetical protein
MLEQTDLTRLYLAWRETLKGRALGFDPRDCSAPLLLNMPDTYARADRRVLFCGQETFGWKGMDLTARDGKAERETAPDEQVETLNDFIAVENAVDSLTRGYEHFSFAKHYRGRGSPFWAAFREVQAWNLGEVLWTNLSRFDHQGGSILNSPQRKEALAAQSDLLAREIEVTKPDTALFVTGPRYDWLLESLFPGLRFEALGGLPSVVRLHHHHLPLRAFRTYHPNALRRMKRWTDLQVVRDAIDQV